MIMSVWPTSLHVEENKKKGAGEHKTEQGEREKERWRTGGGRERKCPLSKTKGEQTNAFFVEKQDNRRGRKRRRRSRIRRWRMRMVVVGGHLCFC